LLEKSNCLSLSDKACNGDFEEVRQLFRKLFADFPASVFDEAERLIIRLDRQNTGVRIQNKDGLLM